MRILKLSIYVVFNVALLAALLLVPAWTLDWWRAWMFVAVVFLATSAIAINVLARNESFLNERLKSPIQAGQPFADKIVVLLSLVTWGGAIVFISLDVRRLHLMHGPAWPIGFLGLVLVGAGYWMIYLAFRENCFAALVVRYQKERRHAVVDSGIYGYVRHPLYAGGVLAWVGVALWLGSYAAALLMVVPTGVIAVRLFFEERFLRRELPDYDAYAARVHYRLIPFLW
jgi:protein-S-isoprenylcysteine O-methyltransferase Ste14